MQRIRGLWDAIFNSRMNSINSHTSLVEEGLNNVKQF